MAARVSSVTQRSTLLLPGVSAKALKSSGLPITTTGRLAHGIPKGPLNDLEPEMPTGTIGTRFCSAMRAMPVLPLYRRPSGERVPSG